MPFYCENIEERLRNTNDCDKYCDPETQCNCEIRDDNMMDTPEQIDERTKVLRDSELGKKLIETLSSQLGMEPASIDCSIRDIAKKAQFVYLARIEEGLKEAMERKAQEWLDTKTEGILQAMYDKAMNDDVLIEADGKYSVAKIQEKIMEKVKSFFCCRNKNTRDEMQKSLEVLMGHRIDNDFKEAFEELRKECIEKYDKLILKKMMHGMARELGADQKLLTLLNID